MKQAKRKKHQQHGGQSVDATGVSPAGEPEQTPGDTAAKNDPEMAAVAKGLRAAKEAAAKWKKKSKYRHANRKTEIAREQEQSPVDEVKEELKRRGTRMAGV
eukprot:SAG31_NODE_2116_length_6414_cov_2.444181_5_plen_102_part_00